MKCPHCKDSHTKKATASPNPTMMMCTDCGYQWNPVKPEVPRKVTL